MIYNDDTYYIGYHRNVRVLGAFAALVFDTICGLIVNSDGVISNSSIAELLGVEERSVQKYVSKLILLGYVEKVAGNGRGKKTTYILTEKGEQNAPLYAQKGRTKCTLKGEQNVPLNNKVNNKVFIRTSACANDEQKKEIMEDFNLFFNLFNPDEDHAIERNRCENKWRYLPEDVKRAILEELQAGKKSVKTQSPYVYLENYKKPLPFYRQQTAAFAHFIEEHEKKDRIVILRYEGSLAYCLLDDMPKMMDAGAEFVRNFNFQ